MIRSVFVLNNQDIYMERHYTAPVSREVPQQFALVASQYPRKADVPSVLQVSDHIVANLTIDQLTFVAVVGYDCNAYAPLQFLQILSNIFTEYGGCTTENIIDNYFVLYQVLEEICDGGVPLTTDMSIMRHIVPPATSWNAFVNGFEDLMKMTKKDQPKMTSMQSNITRDLPNDSIQVNWRPNINHPIQSITTEILEKVDITTDEQGIAKAISAQGYVDMNVKMQGMPELTTSFNQPSVILDASLAKNVMIAAWNRDKTLHVLPLDGDQNVCQFKSQVDMNNIPIEIRIDQQLKHNKKEYVVNVNQIRSMNKSDLGQPKVSDIQVYIPLSDYDLVSETTSDGSTQLSLADANRWILWKVDLHDFKGKLTLRLEPRKQGHISRLPIVKAWYTLHNYVASGLNITQINIINSTAKVFQKIEASTEVAIEIKN
uniref:Adaptor complexes medium subunit family protein n=1 Tax=Trepomonas sp. PC1 TaxID=1076344 RepID=A0A146K7W5_9EUKA|eukprot:JAP91686.1 Adaptor complexes medium subunit family protein [Trepomonas sp. PC1]